MVVIRCTQKLLKRIGLPLRSPGRPTNGPERATHGASTTRLGDWFANLVQVGRQHFILLVSERTRVPVVVRAKDAKRLGAHLSEALPDVLRALGVRDEVINREIDEMREWVYAPTNDRSVVGTLNEFGYFLARHVEEEPEAGLTKLALELSGIPVLVLDESIRRLTLRALEGDALTPAPATTARTYRLKVTLIDSKPAIWRRFEVPADISLERFHAVLQIVMGWTNSHLHAFEKDGTIYGTYDSESGIECVDERLRRLSDVLTSAGMSLEYEYDFGDGWQHRIVLEAIVDANGRVARVLEGQRACPPEDVGGIGGYEEFLEAIGNPKHPEHKELMSWSGGRFDPEAYDVAGANARLAKVSLRPRNSGPAAHPLVH